MKTWKRSTREWRILTETGAPVADVWSKNALDLIEAAPDLLEACELMLTVYGLSQEAPHAVDVMRAAVAKAKGETP